MKEALLSMAGETLGKNSVNKTLFVEILLFSLPIMAVEIMQLLFNTVDMIVAGRFSGSNALAAIGSTGAIVNLIVTLFMGLSAGTSVVIARDYGAGNDEDISRSVHTTVTLSAIMGIGVMILGIAVCRPLVIAMGTPSDILDASVLYLKIYFYSIPASMVYNFGAAIFRAVGDSRRPMVFLAITGVLHVGLSLLFVPVFHMGVGGVALSTVISTYCSAFLVILFLMRSDSAIRFELRKMRIDPEKLRYILRIGVPAGIQSLLFSISNVLVQSAINSFGSAMVAGNSAASNIENYLATSMIAYYNAALTFTSQSIGAKKYDRIGTIAKMVAALVTGTCILLGGFVILFKVPLITVFTTDRSVIPFGSMRLNILMAAYFVNGIMNVIPGLSRAMGYSISSMLCTLVGACLLRIVWLNTVFVWYHTEIMLFMCYPVTWSLAGLGQLAIYFYARSKLPRLSSDESHADKTGYVSKSL